MRWFSSKKNSLLFKIIAAVSLCGLLLLLASMFLMSDTMNRVKQNLMNDRLASDLRFLRDSLGEGPDSQWTLRDDGLYLGDTLIGDGDPTHANDSVFYHCEEITGTFFYVFSRTENDNELNWNADGKYQQGHYLRVCGTTKGPRGENIVGTYIDKKVADAIEASGSGVFTADANVNGRMVFCRYELLRDRDGNIVGIISDGRSVEEMYALASRQKTTGILLTSCTVLLLIVGLGLMISSMVHSIGIITARLRQVGAGELPEDPLPITGNDEISEITKSVNDMVDNLRESQRMRKELDLAARIQLSLLPALSEVKPFEDYFRISCTMQAAKDVGGDFYDFYMLDDEHLVIVVADVCGKGIPAALFGAYAKTILKSQTALLKNLEDAFSKANNLLYSSNSEKMFLTVFQGILNLKTGELIYVNAGHENPFILRVGSPCRIIRTRHNFVLSGMENVSYEAGSLMLNPGDILFQYSDGVTESTDSAGELFGENRLKCALNAESVRSSEDVIPSVSDRIGAFVGTAPQFDDITMLCVEFKAFLP